MSVALVWAMMSTKLLATPSHTHTWEIDGLAENEYRTAPFDSLSGCDRDEEGVQRAGPAATQQSSTIAKRTLRCRTWTVDCGAHHYIKGMSQNI